MKIVVNKAYGGFVLSEECLDALCVEDEYDVERNDIRLIELIEQNGIEWASWGDAELVIVEIPDNATDWEINENDGYETVIAVVDGKLKHF